jgi:hypothetical protein
MTAGVPPTVSPLWWSTTFSTKKSFLQPERSSLVKPEYAADGIDALNPDLSN